MPVPTRNLSRTLAIGALLTLAAGACDDGAPECTTALANIAFEPASPVTLERVMGGEFVQPVFIDECGDPLASSRFADDIEWSSGNSSVVTVFAFTGSSGQQPWAFLRAEAFGATTVTASVLRFGSTIEGELAVEVARPDHQTSGFSVLGSGSVDPYTTDLWVHGGHAYTGSRPWTCGGSCEGLDGWLYVWSLDGAGGITRVDSVAMPAAKINDIKVSADGTFGVASLELGGAGVNGIVVLDLANPAAPSILSHHTAGLDQGIHNVWIETIGGRDYVFAAHNVSNGEGGVHIVDVTDRAAPAEVARFWAGESFVHDVYVRDGLAFVSHWNAGLVILDVGNGIAGGSPSDPVEVSRIVTDGGHVHNAWYWPAGDVVFVGEEHFPPPDRIDEVGGIHVVDVSDLTQPAEVATYDLPDHSVHNFWVDEAAGVLYAAWYGNGLRAIDVSGTLAGELSTQGRELGHVLPSGHRGAGSIWAPQLHNGIIYLSDIYNGIWAVRFDG